MKKYAGVLLVLACLFVRTTQAQSFNQLASDTFARANQNPLSGNWSPALGISANAQIVSNSVEYATGASQTAYGYYNAVSWPNDQYSEVVAVADSAGSVGNLMAAVRMSTTVNTMYYGGATNGSFGSSVTFQIKKRVAGTVTGLATATKPYAAGDVIRLAVQGTTLTLYLNGVSIATVNDTSIASGRAGFMVQTDANAADVRFNNWAGGSITGSGPQVYVTQSGAASGVCTTGVQSLAWFNNSANWGTGAGQIGPSTTVHLCGIFTGALSTNLLTVQGSGASGQPITLLFDTGAKISSPACPGKNAAVSGCINTAGNAYITIDGDITGGRQGIIENTANGTGLANQIQSIAIQGQNSQNLIVRNLTIRNLYVHTSDQDTSLGSAGDVVAINALGSDNAHITNNLIDFAGWALNMGSNNYEVSSNSLADYDHGIADGSHNGPTSGQLIHDNSFGSMSAWDTTANSYHHDGVHFFSENGVHTSPMIYNNRFIGDIGNNATAWIYMEGSQSHAQGIHGALIFNNVLIDTAARGKNQIWNQGNTVSDDVGVYNNFIYVGNTRSGGSPIIARSITNYKQVNNVAIGGFSNIQMGEPGITVSGSGTNRNAYLDLNGQFGDNNAYKFTSTFSGSISDWRSSCSCDALGLEATTSVLNFDLSSGVPNSGSIVIGKGQNLTSLGIAALNVDITGAPRPSGTSNWDIGAYNFGSGSGPAVNLSSTSLAFGSVVVGNPSASQTVTLTNTGSATLNISNIAFSGTNAGDFSKTTTCGATVAAQGNCTVTVTFTPGAAGARSATLSFTDNAVDSPQQVTLSGTGTTIALVHFSACPSQSWTGSCAITTTAAGNSLIVGFTSNNGQGGATITAVTDSAGDSCTQVPAARSTNSTPNSFADIWTCFGGKGGATTITVTTSATATGELGVWEVSNVSAVDVKCALNSQASSTTPTGCSLTTTVPSEFLVELADFQGSITGINTGNAFTSDSTQQGNGFAHRSVSATGAYNAQWMSSVAGTYNTSGVSVH